MTRQFENHGRDQFNVENVTTNITNVINVITSELPPLSSQEIPSARKVVNYIGALLFLVIVLFWWSLCRLFTKCSFPFKQILSLIKASLTLIPASSRDGKNGLESLWQEIDRQLQGRLGLSWQDLNINSADRREYSRLNKQENETWLIRKLLEIISSGSRSKSSEIEKIMELLQKQEEFIALNVELLRKKFEPGLDQFQKFHTKFLEGYSDIERDYRKIDQILAGLLYKFVVSPSAAKNSPKEQGETLIEELRQIIVDNPYNIDTSSRLETLRNVLQLIEWIAATGYRSSFEYEFKTEVDSARKAKAIELIIEQMEQLLKRTIDDISDKTLSSINLGVKKQWINEIMIYGINYRGLAVVEFVLEIDWDKFNVWRSESVFDKGVKVRWGRNKLATEIDKTLNRFNKFIRDNHLDSDLRVSYSPGLDVEEINKILGFVDAPIDWDDQNIDDQEEKTKVQDLAELGIGLYFKPREVSYFGIKR